MARSGVTSSLLKDDWAINEIIAPSSSRIFVLTANKNRIEGHVEYVFIDFSENGLDQILKILFQKRVQSIIVEGGSITLQYFIDSGLWDEARVIIGQKKIGDGISAPNAIQFESKPNATMILEGDVLKEWVNHQAR